MKKILTVTVLTLGLICAGTLSYAKDKKNDGDKICPITGKKMGAGMMGHASMAATSDGGVIVLKGCKLTKYDKDLTVVKEVTMECNKDMLCPMCKMKMGKDDSAPEEAAK
jgi:hypothetical protein